MNQHEKIQAALNLCNKIAQLESFLWERYYKEFLDLLAKEDLKNPSEHIKELQMPF